MITDTIPKEIALNLKLAWKTQAQSEECAKVQSDSS